MKNNPIRDMLRDMSLVASTHPDEYPLMIASTWNLLTDIVDGSEQEIDGLNTHSEEDYRTIIQQIAEAPTEQEKEELRDMYMDWGPEPVNVPVELRSLEQLASMIDILYDLYGGQCDLQIKSLPDIPDGDDYDYKWEVIPDTEDYHTEPPHDLIRHNNPRTHVFHVRPTNDGGFTITTGKAKEES